MADTQIRYALPNGDGVNVTDNGSGVVRMALTDFDEMMSLVGAVREPG